MDHSDDIRGGISRRAMLLGTAGVAGAALLPSLPTWALAADYPALGTFPAGQAGDSVFVGIDVPLTGTYAAAGADEQKGIELAIEHLNNGDDLIKAISSKTTKGVLGKKVTSGAADEAAKADIAVQNATKFIQDNKASVLIGSVSSGTAVALNHFAQDQKVIYLPGISGSNDTTGKDCTRYSFRACFYAYIGLRSDRPGAARQARQDPQGGLPDAGLHLRPHRLQLDDPFHRGRRLDRP